MSSIRGWDCIMILLETYFFLLMNESASFQSGKEHMNVGKMMTHSCKTAHMHNIHEDESLTAVSMRLQFRVQKKHQTEHMSKPATQGT